MDTSWLPFAQCRGAPLPLFVPDTEADQPPPGVLAYCDPCAVRDRCLAHALTYGEQGYWGGTSSRQRRQLIRPRRRVGCPLCRDPAAVVPLGDHQVCLACSVSWPVVAQAG